MLSKENREDILNKEDQFNLFGAIRFELKSYMGRKLYSKKPPFKLLEGKPKLLHLGSSMRLLPDFINADFYVFREMIPFAQKKSWDWFLDLRYPLNCPSDSWDGIFSEHVLEHLYPDQVLALLKELHRVLKPGSWLRISVPDVEKYVNHYNGMKQEGFEVWGTGCEALRSISQNWTHISLWDTELLSLFLKEAGFNKVESRNFGEGVDSQLIKEQEHRAWESLYVEAQK